MHRIELQQNQRQTQAAAHTLTADQLYLVTSAHAVTYKHHTISPLMK